MNESQQTIWQWTTATFGMPTVCEAAARANAEMAKLLAGVANGADDTALRAEIADVVLTLNQLMTALNGDLQEEVNRRMFVNRRRRHVEKT